jgi:hypothetical protein
MSIAILLVVKTLAKEVCALLDTHTSSPLPKLIGRYPPAADS